MTITITRPEEKDFDGLKDFFTLTIKDAFIQDNIDTSKDGDLKSEIEKQISFAREDIVSNGSKRFFLLAKNENQIIGTISSANPTTNTIIIDNLSKVDFSNIPEISSVYVRPEFQEKGVGSVMLNYILSYFYGKNIETFCLDGGYKKSQQYWIKRFGEPTLTLRDYWGKDSHHMIWIRNLRDIKIAFKVN